MFLSFFHLFFILPVLNYISVYCIYFGSLGIVAATTSICSFMLTHEITRKKKYYRYTLILRSSNVTPNIILDSVILGVRIGKICTCVCHKCIMKSNVIAPYFPKLGSNTSR